MLGRALADMHEEVLYREMGQLGPAADVLGGSITNESVLPTVNWQEWK